VGRKKGLERRAERGGLGGEIISLTKRKRGKRQEKKRSKDPPAGNWQNQKGSTMIGKRETKRP